MYETTVLIILKMYLSATGKVSSPAPTHSAYLIEYNFESSLNIIFTYVNKYFIQLVCRLWANMCNAAWSVRVRIDH